MFSRFDSTTRFILLLTIFSLCICLWFHFDAYGQLPSDVQSASVSVGLDKIVDDTGWNVLAAAPYDLGAIDGYVAGIAQGGDIIRGKYHAEGGFNVGSFRAVVFTKGTVKGYSLDTLGRDSRFGVGLDTPSVSGVSVRVGVFGVNADEFGPPNARQTLENNGYDPNDLDGRELESLHPPPAGLSFVAGNSFNALGEASFSVRGVSCKVAVMPQITGTEKVHQGILSAFVNKSLGDNISVDLGAELGLQRLSDGTVESETAYFVGVGLDF